MKAQPAAAVAPDSSTTLSQPQAFAAIAFSALGWAFDLFDLFILLYVAPILGRVFFPSRHQMLSLAGVYAAFTATLVMRPVGGYAFGRYADRNGRRGAMVAAATGVGVATALMGCLPGVDSIGAAATLLFVALRLLQGVFMGGMVASTHTLGTESIDRRHRGLASGIISGGGSGVGKLLASLVFLVVTSICSPQQFRQWGWRLMFFSGLLSSLLGLLVFTRLHESPLWENARRADRAHPGGDAPAPPRLAGLGPAVVACVLLTTAGGGLSYLSSGCLPSLLKLFKHLPPAVLGRTLSLSALAVIGCSVLAGQLSDTLGRRRAMLLYGAAALVLLPLLYRALVRAESPAAITLDAALLSGVGTLCYAPLLIVLNERFPTALRSSGTALSWNTGFALGGSMPVVVSLLSRFSRDLPLVLALASAALALLYLAVAWLAPLRVNRME